MHLFLDFGGDFDACLLSGRWIGRVLGIEGFGGFDVVAFLFKSLQWNYFFVLKIVSKD